MPALPFEIVLLVLEELKDSKEGRQTVFSCALVCRAWVPFSRSIVFNSISLHVQTKPILFKRFLRLCNSPHETFSKADTKSLSVSHYLKQNSIEHCKAEDLYLNKLLPWRSSDGKRTISTIFPKLNKIVLHGVDWWTLSAQAKTALYDGFRSLEQLELYYVNFDAYDEFSTLLHSFPMLSHLELTSCSGPSIAETPCMGGLPLKNLQSLTIRSMRDVKLLSSITPIPTLRTFRCDQPSYISDQESDFTEALAIQQLLSAAECLQEFIFEAGYYYESSLPVLDCYLRCIDLTSHTHLHSLELSTHSDSILNFLERLASSQSSQPHLTTLKLPYLPALGIDWDQLDHILQQPYFSSLTEIRCYFFCLFSPEDVIEQPKAHWYDMPDPDSLAERELQARVEEFKSRLLRCDKRGILRPCVDYLYAARLWEERTIFHHRRTRREKLVSALRRAMNYMRRFRRRRASVGL